MTIERTTLLTLRTLAATAAVALLAACASPSGDADGAGDDAAPSGGLAPACVQKEDFTYEGEDGETALDLLLEEDPTAETSGEGENAFVTGICGYTASEEEKEFWALYVDGEMAEVGAGTLETEDGQEITWKLETY